MKLSSTLLFCCLFIFTANSQDWKFTSHLGFSLPQKQMSKNIKGIYGLNAGLLYSLPGQWKNLSLGHELGIGTYARKTVDQTFTFDNLTTTVPVNYNSNAFHGNLQARFNMWDEKKFFVVPYFSAKGGLYSFYSNVVVEDPYDPDGCKALDRENIMNDRTLFWSAGGGFLVDLEFFKKKAHRRVGLDEGGKVRLDISAHVIRGGNMDYINTRHLMNPQDAPEPGAKELKARFMNVSTQNIHEHSIAQVYNSPLRLFEIKAGIVVVL